MRKQPSLVRLLQSAVCLEEVERAAIGVGVCRRAAIYFRHNVRAGGGHTRQFNQLIKSFRALVPTKHFDKALIGRVHNVPCIHACTQTRLLACLYKDVLQPLRVLRDHNVLHGYRRGRGLPALQCLIVKFWQFVAHPSAANVVQVLPRHAKKFSQRRMLRRNFLCGLFRYLTRVTINAGVGVAPWL